jgi:hypothetical protein
MSTSYIPVALRHRVAEHFQQLCCYCKTSILIVGAEFTIDHIIPVSLGGETRFENLCLACWECNLHKQNQLVVTDPDTGVKVRLFHPHRQQWTDHFAWIENGLLLIGMTASGRATINTLKLNRFRLVNARRLWIAAGWHPPI